LSFPAAAAFSLKSATGSSSSSSSSSLYIVVVVVILRVGLKLFKVLECGFCLELLQPNLKNNN
jgi:hypothetical protein